MARLEFTLNGSKSITDKIGIEHLTDLQNFNVTTFRDKYLRFEVLNLEKLGRWLDRGSRNPTLGAEAFLQKRVQTDSQYATHAYLTEQKWLSSSQVRGYLLKERLSAKQRGVGRPSLHQSKLRALTNYQLNKMFHSA